MIDEERRLYATSTEIICLTKLESKLLGYLIKNKKKVVSFTDIAYYIYGEDYKYREETIRSTVWNLNHSIKDINIVNVYGYGYVILSKWEDQR